MSEASIKPTTEPPTGPSTEPIIEAVGVEKSYPQADGTRIQVVGLTNLVIEPGKIVALLGPSGCGKSTLLRMLTGLSQPSSGTLLWHGKPLDGQMPNVAIVFQSFALFPWLTVLENVEAPLEAKGVPAVERRKRALRTLDTVGLDGFETAYPKELSGGMKQRVGFARALVVEPEVLFMDEPFSALDVLTAENLRGELLELWLNKKMPASAIFIVTHNIEEAVMLADRVMVLGRNPARIRSDFNIRLKHPRDRKSARFVELVDYIYKVMTEPEIEHATARCRDHGGNHSAHGRADERCAEEAGSARPHGEIPDAAPCARRRNRGPDGIAARSRRARGFVPPGRRTGDGRRRPASDS